MGLEERYRGKISGGVHRGSNRSSTRRRRWDWFQNVFFFFSFCKVWSDCLTAKINLNEGFGGRSSTVCRSRWDVKVNKGWLWNFQWKMGLRWDDAPTVRWGRMPLYSTPTDLPKARETGSGVSVLEMATSPLFTSKVVGDSDFPFGTRKNEITARHYIAGSMLLSCSISSAGRECYSSVIRWTEVNLSLWCVSSKVKSPRHRNPWKPSILLRSSPLRSPNLFGRNWFQSYCYNVSSFFNHLFGIRTIMLQSNSTGRRFWSNPTPTMLLYIE